MHPWPCTSCTSITLLHLEDNYFLFQLHYHLPTFCVTHHPFTTYPYVTFETSSIINNVLIHISCILIYPYPNIILRVINFTFHLSFSSSKICQLNILLASTHHVKLCSNSFWFLNTYNHPMWTFVSTIIDWKNIIPKQQCFNPCVLHHYHALHTSILTTSRGLLFSLSSFILIIQLFVRFTIVLTHVHPWQFKLHPKSTMF